MHRRARAGWAGFVNGAASRGGGGRGRGRGAGPSRATQPRSSNPHTRRPRSPVAWDLRGMESRPPPYTASWRWEGEGRRGFTPTPQTQSSQWNRHAPLQGQSVAQGLSLQSYLAAVPSPTRSFEGCRGHTFPIIPSLPPQTRSVGLGVGLGADGVLAPK